MTLREKISRVVALIGILAFGILWFYKPEYSADAVQDRLLESVIYHALGSIIFLALAFYLNMQIWNRPAKGTWLVLLPCLAVVVNNFPFLALAWGETTLVRPDLLPLFLADCLLIGVFEELAFRGVFFVAILEKRRTSKKSIFWTSVVSSALFGLVHLANLLEGAGLPATLLQVGYSFLIGGMCAIVLLKTGNILFPILLHAIFDVGGMWLGSVGAGKIWNAPTVIITAVLGVAVTVYMLYVLLHIDPAATDRFYPARKEENDGATDDIAD